MSDREDEIRLKQLEIAIATRKEEIDRFWSRSSFFWVVVAAALAGLAALENSGAEIVRQLVAGFGLIASLAWYQCNVASKQWQQVWEEKAVVVERRYYGTSLFSESDEDRWNAPVNVRQGRPSVSKQATLVSVYAIALWLMLLYHVAPPRLPLDQNATMAGFVIFVAAVTLIKFGQATRPAPSNESAELKPPAG